MAVKHRRAKFIINVLSILLVSLLIFVEGADNLYRCPDQEQSMRTLGDKCYLFVQNEVDWYQARKHCQRLGGDLITITSSDIQTFVVQVLHEIWGKNGMWIGASDVVREGYWKWVNDQNLSSGYQNWDVNQPSCNFPSVLCHEDCACLRKDQEYKWHDYFCSSQLYKYGYTCQFNMLSPATTSTITTVATSSSTASATIEDNSTTTSSSSLPSTLPLEFHLKSESNTTTEVLGKHSGSDTLNQMESQQLSSSSNDNGMHTGGLVGLVVSFVLIFIAGFVVGILIFRRRNNGKRYMETVDIGFNNVLYMPTNCKEPGQVKDTNEQTVEYNCEDNNEHRYVYIDDIATNVRHSACMNNDQSSTSIVRDNIYDEVKYSQDNKSEMKEY